MDNKCKKRKFTKLDCMIILSNINYRLKKNKYTKRKEIRYYKCELCGYYHLTSQRKDKENE